MNAKRSGVSPYATRSSHDRPRSGAEKFDAFVAEPEIVLVDTHPDIAFAHICSIPTLMAIKHGVPVFSQAAALAATTLEELITAVREPNVDTAVAAGAAIPQKRSA